MGFFNRIENYGQVHLWTPILWDHNMACNWCIFFVCGKKNKVALSSWFYCCSGKKKDSVCGKSQSSGHSLSALSLVTSCQRALRHFGDSELLYDVRVLESCLQRKSQNELGHFPSVFELWSNFSFCLEDCRCYCPADCRHCCCPWLLCSVLFFVFDQVAAQQHYIICKQQVNEGAFLCRVFLNMCLV